SIQSHATSNPNSIAQKAAVEALNGPQEAVMRMKAAFEKRRDSMYEQVSGMKYVKCIKPEGAFYLFIDVSDVLAKSYKGEKIETTTKMAQILPEDYAVAVVPCVDFGYPEHIRLSYAISRAQIKKGLDRIEEFLNTIN
ncbi:MAG: aminotransferase class I/II-fold pyridoxal phosphate-dependent enzyme, partial [Lachnospiraceae bacterium]|nr:aminotransferase class I/II-fold pyridoxal phosphate-dependent enzyme [Lachnospiraceae bacterium]